ncbi:unnamed protein product [Cuscuta campestris]|uniref:Uncharacterized protein n=1 Tax=Cuscuta campestris TaxID=132261 RepID=A0A484LYK2_9ASTE|nr:unnamed protein product [Cuscuta campestris]
MVVWDGRDNDADGTGGGCSEDEIGGGGDSGQCQHNISPNVEIVAMDYVNTAMERLAKADVKYGFVLDFSTEYS